MTAPTEAGATGVLRRISLTVDACEKRAADAADELKPYYRQAANDEQQTFELIKELRDAAADFLHCESCAHNAVAIVAPRNRLRAVLKRFDGAQP